MISPGVAAFGYRCRRSGIHPPGVSITSEPHTTPANLENVPATCHTRRTGNRGPLHGRWALAGLAIIVRASGSWDDITTRLALQGTLFPGVSKLHRPYLESMMGSSVQCFGVVQMPMFSREELANRSAVMRDVSAVRRQGASNRRHDSVVAQSCIVRPGG